MRRLSVVLTAFVCLAALAGCGKQTSVTGSSAGSSGAKRLLRVGDKAEYVLNQSVPNPLSKNSVSEVKGSRTITILAASNHGRSLPAHIIKSFDVREDVMLGYGRSITVISWLGEDASGGLYLLGLAYDGRNWDIVTDQSPPMYMPAIMTIGDSWQCLAHLASGNTESWSMKCLSREKRSIPLGEVDAYKVSITTSSTKLSVNTTGHLWFAPQWPFAFEVAGNFTGSSQIGGMAIQSSHAYSLQSLTLAD